MRVCPTRTRKHVRTGQPISALAQLCARASQQPIKVLCQHLHLSHYIYIYIYMCIYICIINYETQKYILTKHSFTVSAFADNE